jgi:selenocysteine lyase/cysteine desulfurase
VNGDRGGPSESERVRAMREVLTATGAGFYLATHVAGPLPVETVTAVRESDDMELRVGRVGPDRPGDMDQREKEARAVAAAAIKASPERVFLAHGVGEAATAVALELIAARRALDPRADARIVVLEGADERLVTALHRVASAAGTGLDVLATEPRILAADVVLVVMAHVDGRGDREEVRRLGSTARDAGAALLVDASLSVAAASIEVGTFGADAIVAATHRWLLGPEAVTLAWLAPALGADLPDRLRAAAEPFARGDLLALARSVGWLLMYVELPWVIGRTASLADRLLAGLVAIDGVEVITDATAHAALVAFRIEGWDAESAADELSRSIFAITEAQPEVDLLRVSVGAWNREDELDRFVERVGELAAHTPETLPRKPTLTVISGPVETDE